MMNLKFFNPEIMECCAKQMQIKNKLRSVQGETFCYHCFKYHVQLSLYNSKQELKAILTLTDNECANSGEQFEFERQLKLAI